MHSTKKIIWYQCVFFCINDDSDGPTIDSRNTGRLMLDVLLISETLEGLWKTLEEPLKNTGSFVIGAGVTIDNVDTTDYLYTITRDIIDDIDIEGTFDNQNTRRTGIGGTTDVWNTLGTTMIK